tara:strand:- start:823 stop:1677 length:855 start_codon:yes stop_codon:yes gene_type:complete
VIYFPNAKINLGLQVIGKRDDGFHELKSLFIPVGWCDVLEVHTVEDGVNGKLTLTLEGIKIDGDLDSNLVVKAHEIMAGKFELPEIKATLLKNIPTGAGLGGGSSDGAFMLKAINDLCAINISDDKLEEFAAELGSDCPFFIKNRPALVTGRGEILNEPDFNLGHKETSILIVYPGVGINTKESFSLFNKNNTESRDLAYNKLSKTPLNELKLLIFNSFEEPVKSKVSAINEVTEFITELGADYVQMSGSGSAVFGLFSKNPGKTKWVGEAEKRGWKAYLGAFL